MSGRDDPAAILIADDHPVIVVALAEMLKTAFATRGVRIESAADGDGLLGRLAVASPDCLVLDMHMPGRLRSVPLLQAVLAARPGLNVVVYTGVAQPCLARTALDAGARAYVSKASGLDVVIEAVRAALTGYGYVDRAIDVDAAADHPWYRLTPGERDVLVALARGEVLQAIAIDSRRSYKTVTTHKYNALRKLGLRSNDEIGQYLVEQGLGYLCE